MIYIEDSLGVRVKGICRYEKVGIRKREKGKEGEGKVDEDIWGVFSLLGSFSW